ncbi:unnamed protein product [Prunus armeniaca]
MTDLAEATYVLGIDTSRNREKGSDVPIAKGDKLSTEQAPKSEQEKLEMADKPYATLVGISMLGRFQLNPGQAHWVAGRKVMRYLQRTKNYKLVSREVNNWNYKDLQMLQNVKIH